MSKFYNKKPAIGPRVFGYSDQYSVRNDSINDLKISHKHNTVGKSSKRLARIGDPALIAAKKNDEYVVFAAKIGEWVEDSRINLWYDRGGNKWDVNYEISDKTEPITLSKKEIIEINR